MGQVWDKWDFCPSDKARQPGTGQDTPLRGVPFVPATMWRVCVCVDNLWTTFEPVDNF